MSEFTDLTKSSVLSSTGHRHSATLVSVKKQRGKRFRGLESSKTTLCKTLQRLSATVCLLFWRTETQHKNLSGDTIGELAGGETLTHSHPQPPPTRRTSVTSCVWSFYTSKHSSAVLLLVPGVQGTLNNTISRFRQIGDF